MEMTNNQKYALWLACMSFATALGAVLFIAETFEFQISPFLPVFVSIPLVGAIGILKKNKEVLIASTLISLLFSLLGIMSVGGLFMVSSLALIISSFIYLIGTEEIEATEKVKRAAQLAAFASLIAGIGIVVSESSWLYSSMSVPLVFFEVLSSYSLLVILPLLGLIGIRLGKKDFLSASAAISPVLIAFSVPLLQKPSFLVYPILLISSALIFRSGESKIQKEKVERLKSAVNIEPRLKKIALFLAIISLFAALITTLYSESELIVNGCYSYQTPTSGGTICSDFRPDYVIPVILSTIGIAGILRENKIMLYASAAASFVRMIVNLSPIGVLFVPSFVILILSAFVYQKGIKKVEILEEAAGDRKKYYILLLLFAFLFIWIIAVYLFVHPSSFTGGSGYAYGPAPTKPVP